jgi:Flp pilus assembly protein TadB
MVSCGLVAGSRWRRQRRPKGPSAQGRSIVRSTVYIVLIAWVYIIGMVALTSTSIGGGGATFALLGAGPALVVLWFAARRARRRNRQRSMLEQQVGAGDDGNSEADQR